MWIFECLIFFSDWFKNVSLAYFYLYLPKESESEICSVVSDCLQPHGLYPARLPAHGILQARILEWVAIPFSKGSFDPRSPSLQADSLPSQPLGKVKNTRVGNLSLPKYIFPTQESN